GVGPQRRGALREAVSGRRDQPPTARSGRDEPPGRGSETAGAGRGMAPGGNRNARRGDGAGARILSPGEGGARPAAGRLPKRGDRGGQGGSDGGPASPEAFTARIAPGGDPGRRSADRPGSGDAR